MFSKVIRGSWYILSFVFLRACNDSIALSRSGDGAAGGPSFKRYTANPTYEIQVSSQTQLKSVFPLSRSFMERLSHDIDVEPVFNYTKPTRSRQST